VQLQCNYRLLDSDLHFGAPINVSATCLQHSLKIKDHRIRAERTSMSLSDHGLRVAGTMPLLARLISTRGLRSIIPCMIIYHSALILLKLR
jgi:hypothetical protein